MQSRAIIWYALFITAGILSRSVLAANVNNLIDFSLRDENNAVVLPGRLHVPAEFSQDPNTPRPLILFLPEAGETGTDNLKQINGNIDNLLAEAKQRGAFLYAPQNAGSFSNSTAHTQTLTMIDRAIADLNADSSRVYISGCPWEEATCGTLSTNIQIALPPECQLQADFQIRSSWLHTFRRTALGFSRSQ